MANSAWGELSWSAGVFGGANDVDVSITGQSLTSALNSVSISLSPNVSLTGEQLSTSLNSVSFSITGSVTLTTNLANLTLNSVDAIPITLVSVTAPGTPTTWGSSSWGSGSWGENIGLSLSQGTTTVDVINPAPVTGQLLSTSLNSVTVTGTANISLTGQQLTTSLNSVTPIIDVSTSLTGQSLTSALGIVDPGPDANVTGQQLTLSFNGNVDIDIAVAALVTGQQLTTSLNSVAVDLNTPVDLTTNLATLSLGSISNKIDVIANVTGFVLTGTTSQLYVGAWAPVNTGQSVNWTEVAA